jgi:ribonuclease-3
VKEFENIIGYHFKDKKLIENAMTHSSYANENKSSGVRSYERLEFLGDSILGYVTAEFLFRMRKNAEGDLTKMRAGLVCEQNLALVAEKIGLGKYLILGRGEELTNGRSRPSILADVIEAMIGAVYIDGGFGSAKAVVQKLMKAGIDTVLSGGGLKDYKTKLQEHYHKQGISDIKYTVYKEEGPPHDRVFFVKLNVGGEEIAQGKGSSKKNAEQRAAKQALLNILSKKEN